MNARAEAQAYLDRRYGGRAGGRYVARVLEPSPPAVDAPPWFADDPVARGEVAEGDVVVSPVRTADVRWEELAGEDSGLSEWCEARWLAAFRRLSAVPETLVQSRRSLHRLAETVISPARENANGKIGLRYTRGGFGTPFFGDEVQIRVVGTELVVHERDQERTASIASLADAARHVGRQLLPPLESLDDEPLRLDWAACAFLGDLYGFAASVLEELRADAGEASDPSRVQLWPEHFDLAVELGRERHGERAAYGVSPGDEQHPEPYLYVAPWSPPAAGDLWQASAFPGAELPYAALLSADDQRGCALEFFRLRLEALGSLSP